MENKLLNNPGKESGMMTEGEYCDSSDACLSIVNDTLRKKLFRESQVYVQEKDKLTGGAVPVLRLARILPMPLEGLYKRQKLMRVEFVWLCKV